MPRVVLLLPSATYRAPDFVRAAASVGAQVVIGCEEAQTLAHSMGDRALVVPLDDPDDAAARIAELHERSPVDAVVAVDDQGVLAAAATARRLGFRHNPPEAVRATRDKARLRAVLAADGLEQPPFDVVGPRQDAAAAAEEVGFPCVVKALSLSGSRGVIRADDRAGAAAAAERVRAIATEAGDTSGRVLVEGYVPGVEVAVEALLVGGALQVLAVFDKPDPLEGPYFEETIYVTPSRLPDAVQADVAGAVTRAAAALGLVEGPVHAEARIDGDRVVVLELAARTIGGLCARTLRFGAGMSLEEIVLRHALGLPQDELARERQPAGVMMIPIPAGGILGEVGGIERARAVEGVGGIDITIPPGRPVRPLPEGDRYLGFIFASGPSPEHVESSLRRAHDALDVRIDPADGADDPGCSPRRAG